VALPDTGSSRGRSASRLLHGFFLCRACATTHQTYRSFIRNRGQSHMLNRCQQLPTTLQSNSRHALDSNARVCHSLLNAAQFIDPRGRSRQVRPPSCVASRATTSWCNSRTQLANWSVVATACTASTRSSDQFTLGYDRHEGPGSVWARSARSGDEVDIVGPRARSFSIRGRLAPLPAAHHVPRSALPDGQSVEAPASRLHFVKTDTADRRVDHDVRRKHRGHRIFPLIAWSCQGRSRRTAPRLSASLSRTGHAYLFGSSMS